METHEIVRALYSYVSHAGMEFEAGQLINVFEKGEDGWWWGEVQNSKVEGWFPATYVSSLSQVKKNQKQTRKPHPYFSFPY